MHCPYCNADKESLKVIDSRTCENGRAIRRRRQCLDCSKRFTTYERIEETIRLTVIKRDARRVPWDRAKILTGLERACFKRPVPESELQRIVDEVEEEVFRSYDREVPSAVVGKMVMDRLRRLDQVAYVRFASVYRQFKTLEELVAESQAVLDAHRFEDPSQGKLFIEPPEMRSSGGRPTSGSAGEKRVSDGRSADPRAGERLTNGPVGSGSAGGDSAGNAGGGSMGGVGSRPRGRRGSAAHSTSGDAG